MQPSIGATLHVRSTRVLDDGEVRAGAVAVEVRADRAVVTALDPAQVQDVEVLDVGDALLAPAPLDVHIHGAGGHAVPPDGEAVRLDAALAAGIASARWDRHLPVPIEWLATLPIPAIPARDPADDLHRAATSIAASEGSWCVGLRLEGTFLSPAKAGVWPPAGLREPDVTLLEELDAAARAGGVPLRIVDVAPELPGALDLITRARELGIVVSLAHSDATHPQALAAIDAGASLATHLWNAMRPVTHRDPGIVAAALTDPRVTCELNCDGVHLHPATIALSIAASGRGRWVAISDASPFAGAPIGRYAWAGVQVTHDGTSLRDDEGRLAGSASLLTAAPAVLEDIGIGDVDVAIALGAAPRHVLDPTRPMGLQAGDSLWILEPAG
jgi:N-acetylglucosamine-6-phosphate deacetylase